MDIVGDRTVRDLWADLSEHSGDRTFLVFEDRAGRVSQYTYREFDALIDRTAHLFRTLGITRGAAVVLHGRNSPELLQCQFALAKLGAVTVPLHPRSTRAECADVLERTRASVVVCETEALACYPEGVVRHALVVRGAEPADDAPCADDAPDGRDWPCADRDAPAGTRVADFAAQRDAQPDRLTDPPPLSSTDIAGIVFTSGTTARPKGVVLTHANLLFSGTYVGWQARLGPEDRLLTTMPACHVNFQLNALLPVLVAGATLVAVERYSASNFWRQVRRHDATVVQSIAMMVRTQLLQPPADDDRAHRVREVLYYLPLSDEEKRRFEERFGARILNSYGTSESLVGVITDPPCGPRRWPSIGRVGLGYEARIAGPDGRELPPHAIGEIQVRGVPGRTLMLEYLDDPEATARLYDADGWMHTGDLGVVDPGGWFHYLDRRVHLIKRAGENVSPAEVEAALAEHPQIVEAVVIGVPDPIHDQAVKALVVPAPGASLTEADVQAHCRTRLAEFKVPTIVALVDALPRTRSFKTARASLT